MDAIKQEPIGKIGDNKPPLKARLEISYADLKKRAVELVEAFARAPAEIKDDAMQGKVGDLYRLMSACTSKVETTRKEEKDPFIADGRAVDNFFHEIADPVEKAMKALKGRSDLYLNAKAAAARKALAEEEARKRAEAQAALEAAQRAADAGRAKTADRQLEKAAAATTAATQAQEAAAQAPAAFARTRGEHSMATTQTRWTHDVVDWDVVVAPFGLLGPFLSRDDIDKAIRAFVRQHRDTISLAGVRIYESTTSQFR